MLKICILEQPVGELLFPARTPEDVRLEHAVYMVNERLGQPSRGQSEGLIRSNVKSMPMHHITLINQLFSPAEQLWRPIEEPWPHSSEFEGSFYWPLWYSCESCAEP